ncbi:ATP-dependent DNA ligase [Paenibacillus sp. IHBB 10380]|uniref:ATP-dependent DNA ligase n=1 Tax=Paenibacillus sp. IHBB 10380 TaxID=1566358 RepID=UPI0005CFAA0B|nr:RNA ligase family protein [Paenibacillus sp. IHBB 10380]AJS60960.1 DNA ligase [Paenibacillus sp. IHBB 10380]
MKLNPIRPFEPIRTEIIPTGPQWITQVKWDGVRMLTYYDGLTVRLANRKLNDRTQQYPEFQSPNVYCSASSFIIDGEIVAWEEGKPSFHEVMKRDSARKQQSIELASRQISVTYIVFDVLFANGEWVIDQPLSVRQNLLNEIITPQPHVQIAQSFKEGSTLFEAIKQQGMEGIICKNIDSSYIINGKDNRWQKVKTEQDLYAVVGGLTYKDGVVSSLLLGLFNEEGNYIYIGNAGAGKLTMKEWAALTSRMLPIQIDTNPFSNVPQRSKGAIWLKPTIVVKVNFLEWTHSGTLRHSCIQGVIEDMSISDCRFSQNK